MINVENLSKSYDGVNVINDLSFTINDNEIFGLLGPNGAGKTTTLECIEGLRQFEKGSISINGLKPNDALKNGIIGVQLQNSSLPENMSVQDLLTLYCHWNKQPFNAELFENLGMNLLYQKLYKNISTGQKRKLHLALALISNPDTIFLDEPTAGLDVQSRHQLHQQIRTMKNQGKTIIIASHDMAEVQELCDRVAILVNGTIYAIDDPNVIVSKDNYTNTMEIKLNKPISSFNIEHATYIKTQGNFHSFQIHNIHLAIIHLSNWLKKNDLELIDMIISKPSLEERFIQLTKE